MHLLTPGIKNAQNNTKQIHLLLAKKNPNKHSCSAPLLIHHVYLDCNPRQEVGVGEWGAVACSFQYTAVDCTFNQCKH